MRIVSHKLKYGPDTNSNQYRLYFLGDVHLGNVMANKEKLQEDIDEILNYGPDRAGVILMGDMGDYINEKDKRFQREIIDTEIINPRDPKGIERQTVEALVDYFTPLKESGQILATLGGNHGLTNKSSGQYERWDWLFAEALGCGDLYLGYSGFVRLQFEAERGGAYRTILCHVHHGHQGGRTKGSKVNQLEKDIGKFPDCDFIVRGHSHNLIATSFSQTTIDQRGQNIVFDKVIVGHSGAYLGSLKEGVESYSERKNYRPEIPGCLKTWIRFNSKSYDIFAGV